MYSSPARKQLNQQHSYCNEKSPQRIEQDIDTICWLFCMGLGRKAYTHESVKRGQMDERVNTDMRVKY